MIPPIPAQLAHRPVQGGLAVPWVAVQLPDGMFDFAACEGRRSNLAMIERICQVCGEHIAPPYVFFAADDQIQDMVLDVPPQHPACASYSAEACAMVAGRLAQYRTRPTRASTTEHCAEPGCDCGGWVATDGERDSYQAPAWFAVWCRTYDVIVSGRGVVAAIRAGYAVPGERVQARIRSPLKVRPIGTVTRDSRIAKQTSGGADD